MRKVKFYLLAIFVGMFFVTNAAQAQMDIFFANMSEMANQRYNANVVIDYASRVSVVSFAQYQNGNNPDKKNCRSVYAPYKTPNDTVEDEDVLKNVTCEVRMSSDRKPIVIFKGLPSELMEIIREKEPLTMSIKEDSLFFIY